ncbi:MAG: hypothetical protein AB7N76_05135 [Planctomycetota bacterium]
MAVVEQPIVSPYAALRTRVGHWEPRFPEGLEAGRRPVPAGSDLSHAASTDASRTLLASLLQAIVDQTRAAFQGADLDQVTKIAVDLARRHWDFWRSGFALALDNQEQLPPLAVIARESVQAIALRARRHFPLLDRRSRVDLRSVAFTLSAVLHQAPEIGAQAPSPGDLSAMLLRPADEVEESELLFAAALQTLQVAGLEGGVDRKVCRVLASELWAQLNRIVGEPQVEAVAFLREVRFQAVAAETAETSEVAGVCRAGESLGAQREERIQKAWRALDGAQQRDYQAECALWDESLTDGLQDVD